MISRIRHGSSPAFQNVCHWLRGLKTRSPGPGLDDLVAEQRAHAALEDEAVLVLARVPVQRRGERARRHRMLDEREALARLGPVDHEAHADAPEEALRPSSGPTTFTPGAVASIVDLLSSDSSVARNTSSRRRVCQYDWTAMSDQKRPYRMKRRAELEEQTRTRITESAVALHEELGPAQTSISAIAERAGVRRSTVYRHFPDEEALFAACSSHWRAANPPPGPAAPGRRSTTRPSDRDRAARALRVLRADRGDVHEPAARRAARPDRPAPARATSTATCDRSRTASIAGRGLRGRAARRTRAAIGHALAFPTWRSLTHEQGLGDDEAARADVPARRFLRVAGAGFEPATSGL